MISPHPSYPPLEMAEAGMRVITNSYENKNLSALHENITSFDRFDMDEVAVLLTNIAQRWETDPQAGWRSKPKVDWFFGSQTNLPKVAAELADLLEADWRARAAEIPFPEEDLFLPADISELYAWRETDEQAVCASQLGRPAEAFALCRRLLGRPDLPEPDRQRIAANRDVSVPAMLEAASAYPEALVQSLAAGPGQAEVVVSLIAGPDRETTEQTLNSFLNCCLDVSRVGRFVVLDAGLSAADRARMRKRYGFLEFARRRSGDKPAPLLAQLRAQIDGRFWLHLGEGWRFFAPENFITRLTAVLEAEPQVFQVGINFDDAVKLTGVCAAEEAVRRAPDTGRYLLTEAMATGPAMFDTARLDRARGVQNSDPDPPTQPGRPAAGAELRTASLDEVLCISDLYL
ncbi:hypothetical protein A5706_22475 [Mycobacterium sp. E796]|nr:hypothetical protein A5706_22475 [Mycobacterium sp. E796]